MYQNGPLPWPRRTRFTTPTSWLPTIRPPLELAATGTRLASGLSLGSGCRMQLRTGQAHSRRAVAVELPARTIYVLTGNARKEWQHMIPPVRQLRWSLTVRAGVLAVRP